MKNNKLNMIEDLFRKILGESEVAPGSEVSGKIMSSLARKEFLRFNVLRFNVWYLGGIAAACAFAGIMLLSNPAPKGASESFSGKMTSDSSETKKKGDTLLINETVKPAVKEEGTDVSGGMTVSNKPSDNGIHTKTGVREGSSNQQKGNAVTVPVISAPEVRGGESVLVAGIKASVSRGCVPLYVKFTSTSSGEVLREWNFGDGGTSDMENPEWVFDVAGVYNVTLAAKDAAGREAVTSHEIVVLPKPKAAFDLLPENPVIPADEITFVNQSEGAVSYKWYFGDNSSSQLFAPVHKYNKHGKYDVSLVAVSENGCTDSLSVQDTFTETECYIRFPNAFVPNSGGPVGGYYSKMTDNNNMIFHPVYSGVVDYNLKIYSKQGHLVFQSDDIYLGWDGYYHGQLCTSGVYVWKAEGKFRNGESYVVSGDLTLVNY
jgi:PKD repeat protein